MTIQCFTATHYLQLLAVTSGKNEAKLNMNSIKKILFMYKRADLIIP